ncbi:PepSY domain-containing protein [Staphylococcus equorum]|uniref:PepSY domain-containing protein n=1 Tax=Staphylococcus equorum TaxID=246432 RepID=A0AAP7ICX0_9STAP|nr:PepSY domain-containing protein [Staphylococcus equorum]MDK9862822.1 PepSY domain-containing protein [Staphylococcus equorum]MEB7672414.1 PepSY domain-containing protein [Staphylococcus equorum]MEB7689058.1 PepSY domain-containing protein [Staphylococcus equorum]MEB7717409.1 PepSY domain-containing protein [Staphylococcus equorum]MEB7759103.1 PepSY domain-containing protein [Staphylococcus equorum]
MKLLVKLILIMTCIGLSVALCVIIFLKANQQLMAETDAKAMVEKRYNGDIESIKLTDNKNEFLVKLKSSEGIYHIKVDREKKTISNIKQTKDLKPKKPEPKKEQKKEDKKISEASAKDIAKEHVGGTFKSITLKEDKGIKYYLVTQDISSQKGANIIINHVTGKVSSVAWFNKNNDAASTENQPTQPPPTNQKQRIYSGDDDGDDDSDDDGDDYDDYEDGDD